MNFCGDWCLNVQEHVVVKGNPGSAFPDDCGGFRQALGLAAASAHHLTITRMKPAPARCEPIPAFPLPPEPSTCPAWLSAASAASRCEPFSAPDRQAAAELCVANGCWQ